MSTEDALKIFDELEITTEVAEDDKRTTIKFEFNNKTYTIYQIKSKPAETSQTQTSYVEPTIMAAAISNQEIAYAAPTVRRTTPQSAGDKYGNTYYDNSIDLQNGYDDLLRQDYKLASYDVTDEILTLSFLSDDEIITVNADLSVEEIVEFAKDYGWVKVESDTGLKLTKLTEKTKDSVPYNIEISPNDLDSKRNVAFDSKGNLYDYDTKTGKYVLRTTETISKMMTQGIGDFNVGDIMATIKRNQIVAIMNPESPNGKELTLLTEETKDKIPNGIQVDSRDYSETTERHVAFDNRGNLYDYNKQSGMYEIRTPNKIVKMVSDDNYKAENFTTGDIMATIIRNNSVLGANTLNSELDKIFGEDSTESEKINKFVEKNIEKLLISDLKLEQLIKDANNNCKTKEEKFSYIMAELENACIDAIIMTDKFKADLSNIFNDDDLENIKGIFEVYYSRLKTAGKSDEEIKEIFSGVVSTVNEKFINGESFDYDAKIKFYDLLEEALEKTDKSITQGNFTKEEIKKICATIGDGIDDNELNKLVQSGIITKNGDNYSITKEILDAFCTVNSMDYPNGIASALANLINSSNLDWQYTQNKELYDANWLVGPINGKYIANMTNESVARCLKLSSSDTVSYLKYAHEHQDILDCIKSDNNYKNVIKLLGTDYSSQTTTERIKELKDLKNAGYDIKAEKTSDNKSIKFTITIPEKDAVDNKTHTFTIELPAEKNFVNQLSSELGFSNLKQQAAEDSEFDKAIWTKELEAKVNKVCRNADEVENAKDFMEVYYNKLRAAGKTNSEIINLFKNVAEQSRYCGIDTYYNRLEYYIYNNVDKSITKGCFTKEEIQKMCSGIGDGIDDNEFKTLVDAGILTKNGNDYNISKEIFDIASTVHYENLNRHSYGISSILSCIGISSNVCSMFTMESSTYDYREDVTPLIKDGWLLGPINGQYVPNLKNDSVKRCLESTRSISTYSECLFEAYNYDNDLKNIKNGYNYGHFLRLLNESTRADETTNRINDLKILQRAGYDIKFDYTENGNSLKVMVKIPESDSTDGKSHSFTFEMPIDAEMLLQISKESGFADAKNLISANQNSLNTKSLFGTNSELTVDEFIEALNNGQYLAKCDGCYQLKKVIEKAAQKYKLNNEYDEKDLTKCIIELMNKAAGVENTYPVTLKRETVENLTEKGIFEELDKIINSNELKDLYYFSVDGYIDDFNQGGSGDCWLLAAISALSSNENGRKIINESIQKVVNEEGKTVIRVTFKGIGLSYDITYEEMMEARIVNGKNNSAYSNGDNDVQALELAIEKLRRDIVAGNVTLPYGNYGTSKAEDDGTYGMGINGGFASDVLYYLTGNKIMDGRTLSIRDTDEGRKDDTEFLKSLYNGIKNGTAIGTFTLGGYPNVQAETVDGKYFSWDANIRHAFAVVGMTESTITVANPWEPDKPLTFTWEEFAKLKPLAQIIPTELNEHNYQN